MSVAGAGWTRNIAGRSCGQSLSANLNLAIEEPVSAEFKCLATGCLLCEDNGCKAAPLSRLQKECHTRVRILRTTPCKARGRTWV